MSIIHEALKKAAREESPKPAGEGPRQFRLSTPSAFPFRKILLRVGFLLCVTGGLYLAYLERDVLSRALSIRKILPTAEHPAPNVPLTLAASSATSASPPETSARVNPVHPPGPTADHEKFGMEYYEQGRWADAEREFLLAISLDSQSSRIQNNLGLVLKRLGRDADAESRYGTALQIDPGNVQAMNNLGLLYEQQNRLEEAKRLYEKAIATRPNFPEAHLNYAVLLDRAGYFEESRRHYQSFLSVSTRQQERAVSLVRKHLDRLP